MPNLDMATFSTLGRACFENAFAILPLNSDEAQIGVDDFCNSAGFTTFSTFRDSGHVRTLTDAAVVVEYVAKLAPGLYEFTATSSGSEGSSTRAIVIANAIKNEITFYADNCAGDERALRFCRPLCVFEPGEDDGEEESFTAAMISLLGKKRKGMREKDALIASKDSVIVTLTQDARKSDAKYHGLKEGMKGTLRELGELLQQ